MEDWRKISETKEVSPVQDKKPDIGLTGISAVRGDTGKQTIDAPPQNTPDQPVEPPAPPVEPEQPNPANPPPEHIPKPAVGEAGDAERAESGAEKNEKEIFSGYSHGIERGG